MTCCIRAKVAHFWFNFFDGQCRIWPDHQSTPTVQYIHIHIQYVRCTFACTFDTQLHLIPDILRLLLRVLFIQMTLTFYQSNILIWHLYFYPSMTFRVLFTTLSNTKSGKTSKHQVLPSATAGLKQPKQINRLDKRFRTQTKTSINTVTLSPD